MYLNNCSEMKLHFCEKRTLSRLDMLKKNGPPLETLICVYKDKPIAHSQYEQPLLEVNILHYLFFYSYLFLTLLFKLGFVDGDEIIVYKIHFNFNEKGT